MIRMLTHDRAYALFVERSRCFSRLPEAYYKKQELDKVSHIRRLSYSRSVLCVDLNVVAKTTVDTNPKISKTLSSINYFN